MLNCLVCSPMSWKDVVYELTLTYEAICPTETRCPIPRKTISVSWRCGYSEVKNIGENTLLILISLFNGLTGDIQIEGISLAHCKQSYLRTLLVCPLLASVPPAFKWGKYNISWKWSGPCGLKTFNKQLRRKIRWASFSQLPTDCTSETGTPGHEHEQLQKDLPI